MKRSPQDRITNCGCGRMVGFRVGSRTTSTSYYTNAKLSEQVQKGQYRHGRKWRSKKKRDHVRTKPCPEILFRARLMSYPLGKDHAGLKGREIREENRSPKYFNEKMLCRGDKRKRWNRESWPRKRRLRLRYSNNRAGRPAWCKDPGKRWRCCSNYTNEDLPERG